MTFILMYYFYIFLLSNTARDLLLDAIGLGMQRILRLVW